MKTPRRTQMYNANGPYNSKWNSLWCRRRLSISSRTSLCSHSHVQDYPLVFRFRWTPLQRVPFIGAASRCQSNQELLFYLHRARVLLCLQTNRSREIISFSFVPRRRFLGHSIPCSVLALSFLDRTSFERFYCFHFAVRQFCVNFVPCWIWISSLFAPVFSPLSLLKPIGKCVYRYLIEFIFSPLRSRCLTYWFDR